MKKNIHPQYHKDTQVTCACGNSFTTGSTLSKIQVDICAACHPFFTGQQKYVDTQGRVEKFIKKKQLAKTLKKTKKGKKKADNASKDTTPQTLREMLKKKS